MGLKEEVMNMKKEVEELKEEQENSLAWNILGDYKKANKRQFIVILVILTMWFATGCYLVYILNDIGVIETTVTQENTDGNNNYIGNDGDIINGETNSKDKNQVQEIEK